MAIGKITGTELASEQLTELLEIIRVRYGYDFAGYSEASLKRRFNRFLQISGASADELRYRVVNDDAFFSWLLDSLTVSVTEMFRDPDFYNDLRQLVFPELARLPVIRIWHAGCATGEEAFSMAIMLHEAGLLSRCRIYATDVNAGNIQKAASGIVPLNKMQLYTANYLQAGGKADFSTYYTARYDSAIINRELRRNISCSVHNLAVDDVFNTFQLICCRNVLIYFKRSLQNRALGLFARSLDAGGYLALGSKESLGPTTYQKQFKTVSTDWKIFSTHTSTL